MFDWIRQHENLMWILGIVSVAMFAGTLLLLPLLVALLPVDYFVQEKSSASEWSARYRKFRLPLRIFKNVIGGLLIIVGLAMLVLPGQGLLTILLGLIAVDLPGKRKLILRIARRPRILQAINWMRKTANQPEMEVFLQDASDDIQ